MTMTCYQFRLNGAGFTAYLWAGVWTPPGERGTIRALTIEDNGDNPIRADITYYLLRKWFIGKHFSSLEEIILGKDKGLQGDTKGPEVRSGGVRPADCP